MSGQKTLILIMMIFMAACLETDIYLPAFPDMLTYFDASAASIQRVLTWNFIGLCIAGPIYGPLSDALGRRRPLLSALGLFLVGSMMTVVSQEFEGLLLGRVLQGLGSGGCFTIGSAIIFDAYPAEKSLHALNKLNALVPFMMAAAPMLGGYLNAQFGFRSNFIAVAALVLLSLVVCVLYFDETLPPQRRTSLQPLQMMQQFAETLCHREFCCLALIVSLLFVGYLTFLSGIAVLYVVDLGVAKQSFPFYQGALLFAYFLASISASRLMQRWGVRRFKVVGSGLIGAGGCLLLLTFALAPADPFLLTAAMLPYAFGFVWTQTPYFAALMDLWPNRKGMTASALTSLRLALTAASIGIASQAYDKTAAPLVAVVVSVCLCVVGLVLRYEIIVCPKPN